MAVSNLAKEIAKLKNQNGKDILVYGGAGFRYFPFACSHIDEFIFFANPMMVNKE
jgi:dihydrofolate reductase